MKVITLIVKLSLLADVGAPIVNSTWVLPEVYMLWPERWWTILV